MKKMTEQEQINNEVQTKLAVADANIKALAKSLEDFKDEMRDRDNQRHAETEALRADTNAQIAAIKNSVESIGKHVDNMSITMMIGVGAMVITVVLSIIFK